MDDTREKVEAKYKSFIDFLYKSADEIDKIKGVNSQFSRIKQHFISSLENYIIESEKKLQEAQSGTVWDNLVIAFFGETNAGKSSIIETFRILFDDQDRLEAMKKQGEGIDGLIVGDGQADFTKIYKEYHLKINGKPFTLIDVPGIEGNEDEFKEEIQKALTQAHCVFYVQGHNRQPDAATALKIKRYLSDWVNVYSIYNVRGGSENYDESEDRVTLRSEGVCKAEQLIQSTFQQILGPIYAGNITVQALLALCAHASFSPSCTLLLRRQRNLQECFGDKNAQFDFSQFNRIVQLVDEKSGNFAIEILEANKQKLVTLAKTIYQGLESEIENQKQNTVRLDNMLSVFRRDLDALFYNARTTLDNQLRAVHRKTFVDLKGGVCDIIDNKEYDGDTRKKKIKSVLDKSQSEYSFQMQGVISDELKRLSEKMDEKRRALDKVGFVSFRVLENFSINISSMNFDIALDKIGISLKDVCGFLASVGSGAVAGGFVGPIGAAVGATLGGVFHLVRKSFGDGGRGKAKEEVRKLIDKSGVESERLHLSPILHVLTQNLEGEKQKLKGCIMKEQSNLSLLLEQINETETKIKNFANNVGRKKYGNI